MVLGRSRHHEEDIPYRHDHVCGHIRGFKQDGAASAGNSSICDIPLFPLGFPPLQEK